MQFQKRHSHTSYSLCIFLNHMVAPWGAHAMGPFLPSVDVMVDYSHILLFRRTHPNLSTSLGGLLPLWSVIGDSFICWFWEDFSHLFLLFRMTHRLEDGRELLHDWFPIFDIFRSHCLLIGLCPYIFAQPPSGTLVWIIEIKFYALLDDIGLSL